MEEWGREEREEGDFAKVDNKDLQKKHILEFQTINILKLKHSEMGSRS